MTTSEMRWERIAAAGNAWMAETFSPHREALSLALRQHHERTPGFTASDVPAFFKAKSAELADCLRAVRGPPRVPFVVRG